MSKNVQDPGELAAGWRLLHDDTADGPWNMAVDEAIARAVGDGQAPATLRLYTWSAPTVSLGYLQRTPGGPDLAACRPRGGPPGRGGGGLGGGGGGGGSRWCGG